MEAVRTVFLVRMSTKLAAAGTDATPIWELSGLCGPEIVFIHTPREVQEAGRAQRTPHNGTLRAYRASTANDDAGLHTNCRRSATGRQSHASDWADHVVGHVSQSGLCAAGFNNVRWFGRTPAWFCCAAGLHQLTCSFQKLSSPSRPAECLTLTLTTLG